LIIENGIAKQASRSAALRAQLRAAVIVPSVAFAVVCFFQSILNRKITGKRPDAAQIKQSAQREQYQHARLLLRNVWIFPVRRLPRLKGFVEGLVQAGEELGDLNDQCHGGFTPVLMIPKALPNRFLLLGSQVEADRVGAMTPSRLFCAAGAAIGSCRN
jgi:hypothetical protein